MVRTISLLLLVLAAGCETAPAPPPEVAPSSMPISTDDSRARELYLSGRTKAERFHPEEARRDFEAAIELDPNFALAWLELAWAAPNAQKGAKQIEHAASLLSHAGPGERLRIRASKLEYEGNAEAARTLYRELQRMYPEDARVRYWLGMAYGVGEDEEGTAHLEEAVRLDPGLDVAWNMLGYAYAWQGRLDEALDAHRTYVKLLPDEPNAHDSFAENLLKAGRFEESIAEYEAALELESSFVWSRMGIGHNLVFMGRFDEAKAAYELALEGGQTLSNKLRAAEWLVVRAVYAGDPEEARRATAAVLKLATELGAVERAGALRILARVELFAGNTGAARTLALRARDELPGDLTPRTRQDATHNATRLLLEIESTAGDADAARSRLTELKALDAAGGPPWQKELTSFCEGYLLLSTGDVAGAVKALEKSSSTDPRTLYWLARAHEAGGRRTEALVLYVKVAEWNSAAMGHALVFDDARARRASLEAGEKR